MSRAFIRRHITSTAILAYIILYGIIIYSKSPLIYNKNGTLKSFGVGYSNRSVLSIWVISIVFAILSYLLVLYYISSPYIQ
jgi:hypothetical protein